MRVEVIKGVEGLCLAIDDRRVAGPKPWGGGHVIHSFTVDEKRVSRIAELESKIREQEAEVKLLRKRLGE